MKLAVSRAPGAEREVSPLELFFDLVYVFAIGQLGAALSQLVGGDSDTRVRARRWV